MLNRDLSGLFYPFLGVNLAHHTASHEDTSEAYEKITHFNVSQLAYLAARLDAMPEAEGTVLDNSCILFISSMFSGANHDSTKVPIILAGGLGGTLPTGRVIDYSRAGDDNRKVCAMYLGTHGPDGRSKLDRFGDATDRLKGF